jgi:hypothetical protein
MWVAWKHEWTITNELSERLCIDLRIFNQNLQSESSIRIFNQKKITFTVPLELAYLSMLSYARFMLRKRLVIANAGNIFSCAFCTCDTDPWGQSKPFWWASWCETWKMHGCSCHSHSRGGHASFVADRVLQPLLTCDAIAWAVKYYSTTVLGWWCDAAATRLLLQLAVCCCSYCCCRP